MNTLREKLEELEVAFKLFSEAVKNEFKPDLLSGKVAVRCNPREAQIVADYLKLKGVGHFDGEISVYLEENGHELMPENLQWDFTPNVNPRYTIIPFSDFAAEVGIKVPVFVMTSEEGVPLYEGDKLFEVNKMWNSEKWYLVNADNGKGYWIVRPKSEKWKLGEKDGYISKAFSTKEAAEAWILEANKPKELECKLFGGKTANIHLDLIKVFDGNNTMNLKPSDLEDMLNAYKTISKS